MSIPAQAAAVKIKKTHTKKIIDEQSKNRTCFLWISSLACSLVFFKLKRFLFVRISHSLTRTRARAQNTFYMRSTMWRCNPRVHRTFCLRANWNSNLDHCCTARSTMGELNESMHSVCSTYNQTALPMCDISISIRCCGLRFRVPFSIWN